MSCNKKKMVMNCLDDWCTKVVQFCRAKSKYKDSLLMVSPSMGNTGGCAWHDDSFRGAWCKYDVVSGGGLVGDAVMLSELVGFLYSLCELIYPQYNVICVEIEWAIMKRVDDGCCMANEEVGGVDHMDGGCQEIIPEAEAYIR